MIDAFIGQNRTLNIYEVLLSMFPEQEDSNKRKCVVCLSLQV